LVGQIVQVWINVTLVIDDLNIITEPEKYPNYKLYINFENKAMGENK
jgi:hypothetical protein